MKIIGIPRINALGLKGPQDMSLAVSEEMKNDFEIMDVNNSDIEKSEEQVLDKAREVLSLKEKTCFVGGDHSVTYPILKAFRENYKNAFLIVFDAHADCMLPMKEPTHEEFLRAIVEKGLVKPENVILIGIRKFEDIERKFLEDNKIKVFGEIYDLEAVADYITERANGMDVYVSVDIDVLDPAFAPAVNYPEANGLSSRELFYLLRRIFCIKSLKALDIVEIVPEKDKKYDYRTVQIGTKIVEEFVKSSY